MDEIRLNTNVIELPIDEVKAYHGSHKTSSVVVEMIKNSLRDFGFQQPIVIDNANVVVAGNSLLKAAIELGLDKVPCLKAEYLTDEQIQQYRIADNKTAEFARWNEKKLRSELSYLESPQSLQYCFDTDILAMLGMNQKPKSVPSKSEEEVAKPSQVAKSVVAEEKKDALFKKTLKHEEAQQQAVGHEYWEYTCSKCGKIVRIKKS